MYFELKCKLNCESQFAMKTRFEPQIKFKKKKRSEENGMTNKDEGDYRVSSWMYSACSQMIHHSK